MVRNAEVLNASGLHSSGSGRTLFRYYQLAWGGALAIDGTNFHPRGSSTLAGEGRSRCYYDGLHHVSIDNGSKTFTIELRPNTYWVVEHVYRFLVTSLLVSERYPSTVVS